MTDEPTPEPTATPPQSLGERMGLGPAWLATPAAWALHPLPTTDGSQAWALVLHTAGGTMGAAMSADNLRELVRQASELLEDAPALVVPPQGLLLPTNGQSPNRAHRRHPGAR